MSTLIVTFILFYTAVAITLTIIASAVRKDRWEFLTGAALFFAVILWPIILFVPPIRPTGSLEESLSHLDEILAFKGVALFIFMFHWVVVLCRWFRDKFQGKSAK